MERDRQKDKRMKCILLCAGYATRMYPLTENFPKPLLPIKGKSLIDYLIDDLSDNGLIDGFIVVSNHKFISHFNSWKQTRKENILVLDDGSTANENRLGAVKDIQFAIEKANIDDDILVLAGDNLLEFSLKGEESRCDYDDLIPVNRPIGAYCYVPTTHKVTLGEIVDLLETFKNQPQSLVMPEIPNNSFAKKLYSTYLSYLPKEKVAFPLKGNFDVRGSFTELIKFGSCGQVSINISRPGITKGQHWHNTKWECFSVVKGHGLIQERKIGTDEVIEFEVSGDNIQAVHMLPGYTHNIIN